MRSIKSTLHSESKLSNIIFQDNNLLSGPWLKNTNNGIGASAGV